MSIKRIFHDPIHKEIVFNAGKPEELMIMELIDTVAFQRLRRIKQLGAASLLFHGAESSRFTHSIGVFCIARKIYKRLIESKPSFCENKFVLYGAELGLANTASKLRGESGTKVLVEIFSESGEIREFDLERRSVDLRPVRTKRLRDDSHTIGYLRITQFSESVPNKVEEALQELKEKEVEGLILDLRNNSGGLVSSGIAVADSLLSEKPVVETKDRNGIKDAIISQKETSFDGPMVTLVNKGTASASEILAGSLQDNERSILMGEQTYGKGLIQSLKSLGEDSGIAITVASYLTPDGNNIQGQGITPDKLLDLPDGSDFGSTDDKWVRNAELFLGSLLEKEEVPVQTIELNNAEIKSLND